MKMLDLVLAKVKKQKPSQKKLDEQVEYQYLNLKSPKEMTEKKATAHIGPVIWDIEAQ